MPLAILLDLTLTFQLSGSIAAAYRLEAAAYDLFSIRQCVSPLHSKGVITIDLLLISMGTVPIG